MSRPGSDPAARAIAPITDDAAERSRLDALRRRVYGPEASEADRQEYAALLERVGPPHRLDHDHRDRRHRDRLGRVRDDDRSERHIDARHREERRIDPIRDVGGDPLLLDSAPLGGGTLIVTITSSDPDPIGWVAQRHRDGFHDAGALETVATSIPAPRMGTSAPTVATYTGAPPSQITVRAPIGTGWSITIAFTG